MSYPHTIHFLSYSFWLIHFSYCDLYQHCIICRLVLYPAQGDKSVVPDLITRDICIIDGSYSEQSGIECYSMHLKWRISQFSFDIDSRYLSCFNTLCLDPISNTKSLPQADYFSWDVSFTFIRLLSTWTPTEIFDSFWAKHFSDCDSIICSINNKLRFLKVCKILKRTWHFQTDWILCVLNCSGCSHVVSDTGSTCSWC